MRGLGFVKYSKGGSVDWSALEKFLKKKLEKVRNELNVTYVGDSGDIQYMYGKVAAIEDLLKELGITNSNN